MLLIVKIVNTEEVIEKVEIKTTECCNPDAYYNAVSDYVFNKYNACYEIVPTDDGFVAYVYNN